MRKDGRDAPFSLEPPVTAPETYRPDYESIAWHITEAHRFKHPVNLLVLHHEGSPTIEGSNALAIHRWYLTRPDAEYGATGYHAVIERDGRIAEGRPLWAVGAHARGYNHRAWGACMVGNCDLAPPTGEQMASAVRLFRWWSHLLGAPQMEGHRFLPGMVTECPGRHVDMDGFRRRVATGGGVTHA